MVRETSATEVTVNRQCSCCIGGKIWNIHHHALFIITRLDCLKACFFFTAGLWQNLKVENVF